MGERLAGECVAGIERYISSAIINDGPVQSAYAHFLVSSSHAAHVHTTYIQKLCS